MNASNYNRPTVHPGVSHHTNSMPTSRTPDPYRVTVHPGIIIIEAKSRDAAGKPCILTHIAVKPTPFQAGEKLIWRNRYGEYNDVMYVMEDLTDPESAWVLAANGRQLVYMDSLERPV